MWENMDGEVAIAAVVADEVEGEDAPRGGDGFIGHEGRERPKDERRDMLHDLGARLDGGGEGTVADRAFGRGDGEGANQPVVVGDAGRQHTLDGVDGGGEGDVESGVDGRVPLLGRATGEVHA